MTIPTGQSSGPQRHGGYIWAALAVLTCPCDLPIFAVLVSGSALGAFLIDHFKTALVIFSLLFVFSLAAAVRILGGKKTQLD